MSTAFEAARRGDVEALEGLAPELLIEPNSEGETALHSAAANGQEAAVVFLLEAGACPDAVDCHGATPLDGALLGGHERVAELLRVRRTRVPRGLRSHVLLHGISRLDAGTFALGVVVVGLGVLLGSYLGLEAYPAAHRQAVAWLFPPPSPQQPAVDPALLHLEQARQARAAGDLAMASSIAWVELDASQGPAAAALLEQLASDYERKGQLERAEEQMDLLSVRFPEEERYLEARQRLQRALCARDGEKALQASVDSLAQGRMSSSVLEGRRAVELLVQAQASPESVAEARVQLARGLMRQQFGAEAVIELRQALARSPKPEYARLLEEALAMKPPPRPVAPEKVEEAPPLELEELVETKRRFDLVAAMEAIGEARFVTLPPEAGFQAALDYVTNQEKQSLRVECQHCSGLLIQLVPTPMGVGMFGETGDWEMTWERAREELADSGRLASGPGAAPRDSR
ncbi:MAG: ankyrin repeat domain-containing protein [Armatimonadetes bacterium]|nr:ankyrin repeat domain-containing protein [Armatimonadota bacterium]